VRVASKLRRHFPVVAAALANGRIGWDHARVICEVANPRIIEVVADHQDMIIDLAERFLFEPWRAEVRGLGHLWDQDGGFDPNDDPLANRLSYGTTIDGLLTLAATLTGDNAQVVAQAIETEADALFRRAVADHDTSADLPIPSRSTLRALALTELIRRALGVNLDATRAPRSEVTLTVDATDPTTATDPDGIRLVDGTVRLLACDAVLHALVVDSLGVPLDHGRRLRWAAEAQRRAVRHRDGGCTSRVTPEPRGPRAHGATAR
jgi:hypothetical protein